VGSTRAPRRSTRARPETTHQAPSPDIGNEEIIATARPSQGTEETGGSVVREWVNELTGRNEQGTTGVRVPSDAEITQLTTMFPNMQRAVIVGALQRRLAFLLSREIVSGSDMCLVVQTSRAQLNCSWLPDDFGLAYIFFVETSPHSEQCRTHSWSTGIFLHTKIRSSLWKNTFKPRTRVHPLHTPHPPRPR
jgi:hypothetical protein